MTEKGKEYKEEVDDLKGQAMKGRSRQLRKERNVRKKQTTGKGKECKEEVETENGKK